MCRWRGRRICVRETRGEQLVPKKGLAFDVCMLYVCVCIAHMYIFDLFESEIEKLR